MTALFIYKAARLNDEDAFVVQMGQSDKRPFVEPRPASIVFVTIHQILGQLQ